MYTRAHPTVALFIKNLWREGDAVGRLFLLRDILPHPHAVLLIAGDVQLSVVHLQSIQERNHILLFLLDLLDRDEYITDECTIYWDYY